MIVVRHINTPFSFRAITFSFSYLSLALRTASFVPSFDARHLAHNEKR